MVELPDDDLPRPSLSQEVLTGGLGSYPACQAEARRIRSAGASGLRTPSAALIDGGAVRYYVDGGAKQVRVESDVVALFGARPDLDAVLCALGQPDARILQYVRRLVE
jgi:hypothetical protein